MHCLNCKQEMTNYVIHTPLHHVSYNVCEHCGSLWLDKGVLNKLAPTGSGDIEFCSQDVVAGGGGKPKKCPRCEDETLDRVNFIGNDKIILERCKNCEGFWLDGGQLDKIDEHLEYLMHARKTGFSEFMTETHLPFWVKRTSRPSDDVDKVPVMPIKGAKVQTQTQDMCPVCHINLDLYSDFHIGFEGCPKCRGMWVDEEKIKQLKSKVEDGDIRWMDDELEAIEKTKAMLSNRLCPKCKETKMMSTKFGHSNLIIDWCPSCHGVWLDRDGFLNLVHYLDKEEAHLTPDEMRHEEGEEIKKIWTGHEHKLTEIVDAEKAIGALLRITVTSNPKLSAFLIAAGQASQIAGF